LLMTLPLILTLPRWMAFYIEMRKIGILQSLKVKAKLNVPKSKEIGTVLLVWKALVGGHMPVPPVN
jgi:hypothetical protein